MTRSAFYHGSEQHSQTLRDFRDHQMDLFSTGLQKAPDMIPPFPHIFTTSLSPFKGSLCFASFQGHLTFSVITWPTCSATHSIWLKESCHLNPEVPYADLFVSQPGSLWVTGCMSLHCGQKPAQCAGELSQPLGIIPGAATSSYAGEYWGWRGAT